MNRFLYSWLEKAKSQRGTVIIYVTVAIFVLFGFVAIAVDGGYVMVTRNELQNIADAASLAATRQLGEFYVNDPDIDPRTEAVISAIKKVAENVAIGNQAAGANNQLNLEEDIIIGRWMASERRLIALADLPSAVRPNAVRVRARRDDVANGPVPTFFAKIFGSNFFSARAAAVASLTGQIHAGPGELTIPIGISARYFGLFDPDGNIYLPDFCDKGIRFQPTCKKEPCDPVVDGCGGWHAYTDPNADKPDIQDILQGLQAGTYISPDTVAGETEFRFNGGTITSLFEDMKALFEYMKTRDEDGNPFTWTTSVPVYDSSTCENPNKKKLILGFATIVIENVIQEKTTECPDGKCIDGRVLCDFSEPSRGGGGEFGTWGNIPGLVDKNWENPS